MSKALNSPTDGLLLWLCCGCYRHQQWWVSDFNITCCLYLCFTLCINVWICFIFISTFFRLLTSRLTDLLVGAPMFMVRDSDGRLEELGRVYVYLQMGPLEFAPHLPHFTGTQVFGRFGSSITPLGDLNQDGFNGTKEPKLWYILFFCSCLSACLSSVFFFLQLFL